MRRSGWAVMQGDGQWRGPSVSGDSLAVVQGAVKLKCCPSFGLLLFPSPMSSGRRRLQRLPLPLGSYLTLGLSLTSHPTTWKPQTSVVTKAEARPLVLIGGKGGAGQQSLISSPPTAGNRARLCSSQTIPGCKDRLATLWPLSLYAGSRGLPDIIGFTSPCSHLEPSPGFCP